MSVFTVEIDGVAIAAFNEQGPEEAAAFAKNPEFCGDLTLYERDGAPLWNGVADITVRAATPDEEERWTISRENAEEDGEIEDDDELLLVFLVPVIDPTEDDPPED
jgi:hypothetical protein